MREDNILGKNEFVLAHIFYVLISMIWYKNILLRCIANRSFTESKILLWVLVILCSTIGILVEIKYRRTGESIAVNLLSGYGIYTVLAYRTIRPRLIKIVLVLMAILMIVCDAFILGRKIINRKKYRRIVKRRIALAVKSMQTIFSGGMAVIMLFLGVNIISGSTILNASIPVEKQLSKVSNQTISNNMEEILQLQEEIWCELTVEEKLNILQIVANIERDYLGIANEINVGVANLEKYTLGYYRDSTHQIVINVDSLLKDPADVVLDTLLHEVRHCYQHRLAEVYKNASDELKELRIFTEASSYAAEFEHYVDGYEDYCSYYTQECEIDAREYSQKALYDYYYKIDEYLEENQ